MWYAKRYSLLNAGYFRRFGDRTDEICRNHCRCVVAPLGNGEYRTTLERSGHISNKCCTVLRLRGSMKSDAISASGMRTKRRPAKLGCGTTRLGLSMI